MLAAVRALALLLLLQGTPSLSPTPVPRVVETSRQMTGPLAERVLDLAFADASTLLVLAPDALALYRMEGAELRLLDRAMLPAPLRPVRAPGGLLVLADGGASAWALTSGTPRAALFEVTRSRLDLRGEADAVPWPGVVGGVRFHADTSLLEVALPGVEGSLLRLLAGDEPLAVGAGGELWAAGHALAAPHVGPALAALWPGLVAAASPAPPGESDDVLVVAFAVPQPDIVSRLAVPGAVRALASRTEGRTRKVAAAIEAPDGAFRIVLLDLVQGEP